MLLKRLYESETWTVFCAHGLQVRSGVRCMCVVGGRRREEGLCVCWCGRNLYGWRCAQPGMKASLGMTRRSESTLREKAPLTSSPPEQNRGSTDSTTPAVPLGDQLFFPQHPTLAASHAFRDGVFLCVGPTPQTCTGQRRLRGRLFPASPFPPPWHPSSPTLTTRRRHEL